MSYCSDFLILTNMFKYFTIVFSIIKFAVNLELFIQFEIRIFTKIKILSI